MRLRSQVERALAAAVLAAAPVPAVAHGEQILLMPAGNLVALVTVIVAALAVKVDWGSRALAVLVAVGVCLPPYFVTNRYIPYWLSFSEVAWFVVGLVPPLAVSGLFLFWRLRARQRKAAQRP